jgi:hypothetical protein
VVLMALMVVSGMRWISLWIGMCFPPLERRLAELESSLVQVKLDPAENAPCSLRLSTFR